MTPAPDPMNRVQFALAALCIALLVLMPALL